MLARRHFVVGIFHTDPHILHGKYRLTPQVGGTVYGKAVKVAALVQDVRCLVIGKIEIFQFRTNVHSITLIADLFEGSLQDITGITLIRCAVRIQNVADHPCNRPFRRTPGN